MGVYEFNISAPSIALSPAEFEFFAPEGGDNPADQTLLLRNCGSETLDWAIFGQPAWLSVWPTTGETSDEEVPVTLSVDISDLTHGLYIAALEIADPQAVNSPREVIVKLYVTGTIYVPSEYQTIQAAIDAALPSDEIVVADGTYIGARNKNLDFGGKTLKVRSASGDPALCIIDCELDGRGFNFHSGEGPDSIVEGLTITNGDADNDGGGGVYCVYESSPTLNNCAISGNWAIGWGHVGGGVYCDNSSPTLNNCTICGNSSDSGGGGVFCYSSSHPMFTNCTINGNVTYYDDGGGVFCYDSNPTLTNCMISGNSANFFGGGIYYSGSSSSTLANCTISGNLAGSGGGVYGSFTINPTLINCTITGNSAINDGGGIYSSGTYGGPTLTNCTLTGNSAVNEGGGIYYDCRLSSSTMTNCIFWGDTPQEIYIDSGNPVITYCDVQDGTDEPWFGEGCIDDDPGLAFAEDVHLMDGSPCIDAGTNYPPDGLPDGDLDGNPRPLDGDGDTVAIADMGAYEFNLAAPSIALSPAEFEFSAQEGGDNPVDQTLWLLKCGGEALDWEISGQPGWLTVWPTSGEANEEEVAITLSVNISDLPNGLYTTVLEVTAPLAVNSPRVVVVRLYVGGVLEVPNEYLTIQAAINDALNGDVVEIADGTYTGAGNKDLDFGGKAITVRGTSGDPELCIIDCEGSGRGFNFHRGEGSESIVEGLTITNGYARGGGGGVYCSQTSPTLTNCTIRGNWACDGGGIFCISLSSPTLTNCTITGNSVDGGGGGIYCGDRIRLTLTNCTISENSADYGGGFVCFDSSPTLINCTIGGNAATGDYAYGGGVFCYDSSPTLANSTIIGNSTVYYGGGVYCSHSSYPRLTNCVLSENSALMGGGVYCDDNSRSTLTKCIISGNSAVNDGGGIYGSSTLTNCTISANSANYGGGICCGDYNHSPRLTNCTMLRNLAVNDGGGLYVIGSDSSPTLTNCILWGDTPQEIYVLSGSPIVTYCDVQGGTVEPWFGEGCIDDDPDFAFADDLHLMPDSPCIDAGDNDPPGGLPVDDPDGNLRPLDGDGDTVAIADMGVYEFNLASPSIALSPAEFEFSAQEDGDNPATQTLWLLNCGGGTLNWEILGEPEWLTAWPISGEAGYEEVEVTLSVDISGLEHGLYAGTFEVTDPSAVNSPREVAVTLYVTGTIYVPSDYPTIQAAIDAALPNDEIVLADGTYTGPDNKNLDFGGKAITVRSASGDPELCVIDCENNGRGFNFHAGEGPDSVVKDLTIMNGYAVDGGGVCFYDDSCPTLVNCKIIENWAGGVGGGLYCDDSSPILVNCEICGNSAKSLSHHYGGGAYFYNSNSMLVNCTIIGNATYDGGGGVFCAGSGGSPSLINCTICGNSVNGDGGGVSCYDCSPAITNCIIRENEWQEIYVYSGSPTATYCNVQQGSSEPWFGEGCINTDPLFVDPDGPDDNPNTWEDNDYRMSAGSPCIDAADNAAVPIDVMDFDGDGVVNERLPLDLDGQPRFVNDLSVDDTGVPDPPDYPEVVDMGAYEHQVPFVPVRYVDDDAPLYGDGRSWNTAYRQVQQALSAAADNSDITEIRVAGGAYVPTEQTDPNDPHTATYQLINGVTLSGGYRGMDPNNPGNPDERDPNLFESILSGDLEGNDVAGDPNFAGNDENCYHVVTASATDSTAVLDGFTITAGNANWYDDCMFGGGLFCRDGVPTVNKCTFKNNWAIVGGGFSNNGGNSMIRDCVFTGNRAHFAGGGLFCEVSNPTLTNCTFSNNSAGAAPGGGGVCCLDSSPTLTNCTITENTAYYSGGGMSCSGYSPTLANCTISGNSSENDGGGMTCYGSSPTLTNCTISRNSAENDGGGMTCYGSSPTLNNCMINGNAATGDYAHGGGVYCSGSSSSPSLTNCTIIGNSADYGGGVYCRGSFSNPTLTNCTLTANTASLGAALACDSYQQPSDVTISNCILWNGSAQIWNNDASTLVITYCDIQGELRGEGNIDSVPLFVDPDGYDEDPNTWEDNNYRLSPESPCINAGSNYVDGLPELDIVGASRIRQCRVDMGVYESPHLPFVFLDCNGNWEYDDCDVYDGTSDDYDQNHVPDECDADCNANGVPDACDINCDRGGCAVHPLGCGGSSDDNNNGVPDECDLPGDLDGDGDVDLNDLAELLGRYGSCVGEPTYDSNADFDDSGCIDLSDLAYLLGYYGTGT